MTRRARTAAVLSTAIVQLMLVTPTGAQTQSPPTDPRRVAEMQAHFGQVMRVHEALIRGDLTGVMAPAGELARMQTPIAFPEVGAPFADAIRQAAWRITQATSLRGAAAETVALTSQCAACHRTVGIFPAPSSPRRPTLSNIVGHMQEHQRAADDMLEGLVIPSASRWQQAADELASLPPDKDEWPKDKRLTDDARKADAAIHGMANRVRAATSLPDRSDAYVDFVNACAACHVLGKGAWGPRFAR